MTLSEVTSNIEPYLQIHRQIKNIFHSTCSGEGVCLVRKLNIKYPKHTFLETPCSLAGDQNSENLNVIELVETYKLLSDSYICSMNLKVI